jgi:hypothetical protein
MTGDTDLRQSAGRQLQEACQLLVTPTPENLARCLKLLDAASHALRPGIAPVSNRKSLREVESLRDLVRRAGALLECAAEYHRKWATLAGTMTAGYAAGGQPGQYVASGTLCLRG